MTMKQLIFLMQNPVRLGKSNRPPILQSFTDHSLWRASVVLRCLTQVYLSTDISLLSLFIGLVMSDSCCSKESSSKEEEGYLN